MAQKNNPFLAILLFAFIMGLFSLFNHLMAQSLYQGLRKALTEK